jgi:hypothetical protein
MATIIDSNQYKYGKRGPIDAKAIVKTYADLLDPATWTINDAIAAYNGMMTAVWLDKEDPSKNGVYFLYDPAVTSAVKAPDVTSKANWHKLSSLTELSGLTEQIAAIQTELDLLKDDVDDVVDIQIINGGGPTA